MTLQEAIKNYLQNGRKFKRKHWHSQAWLTQKGSYLCYEVDGKYVNLSINDLLADDYEIKEAWFEGNFKEKYPNGVYCFVSDDKKSWIKIVVTNYKPDLSYPYIDEEGGRWKFAKPIPKDKIPYILTEEED